ncbi:MAG: GTP-binding protein [Promethearchaeota archaeon]
MENKLNTLILDYMNNVEGVLAVVVVDKDGLIIASRFKKSSTNEMAIGAISAIIDNYIKKVKDEFGTEGNFFNITITEQKKFAFCSSGKNAILTSVASPETSDMQLKVYSEYVANKIELLLEGQENISLKIPELIRLLSRSKTEKIKPGEYALKLILAGNPLVGKTSLIKRFVEDRFHKNYISTIGVEISKKKIDISEEIKVKFLIWDIGGQERFDDYRQSFYSGANAAFIVIDRTRKESLKSISKWYDDIKEFIKQNIPIIVVGNKSDLIAEIAINEKEIKEEVDKFNFHYILTSAKTGENVNESFHYVAYKVIEEQL